MNIEIFFTIVAAILVARILSPLADMVKHAVFGSPKAVAKQTASAVMGASSEKASR